MAVDPHADEVKVEISWAKYQLWMAYRKAIAEATTEATRLAAEIKEEMGTATAATVNGVTVATYRRKQGWATKDLIRDYPELTEHYMTMEVEKRLDIYQFAAHHADIAVKYQTREFREVAQ